MTPTPEDIAREAAENLHHNDCNSFHTYGYGNRMGKCDCRVDVRDVLLKAIRSAVQAERAETEAIVNAELQTAAVSVSRGIELGREEATCRYETVVEVLTRTLERLRSRGDK